MPAVIAIIQYVVGNAIASQVVEIVGFSWTMVLGQGFVVLACFYCFLFVKNVIPDKGNAVPIAVTTTAKTSISADVLQLLKDIYVAYTRKRDGHARIYILLITVGFFFYVTVDQGVDNTTALYRSYSNLANKVTISPNFCF